MHVRSRRRCELIVLKRRPKRAGKQVGYRLLMNESTYLYLILNFVCCLLDDIHYLIIVITVFMKFIEIFKFAKLSKHDDMFTEKQICFYHQLLWHECMILSNFKFHFKSHAMSTLRY